MMRIKLGVLRQIIVEELDRYLRRSAGIAPGINPPVGPDNNITPDNQNPDGDEENEEEDDNEQRQNFL